MKRKWPHSNVVWFSGNMGDSWYSFCVLDYCSLIHVVREEESTKNRKVTIFIEWETGV